MGSRSVVTGVTVDDFWRDSGLKNKLWNVQFIRNKNPNWMYIFADDELSAYQAAERK